MTRPNVCRESRSGVNWSVSARLKPPDAVACNSTCQVARGILEHKAHHQSAYSNVTHCQRVRRFTDRSFPVSVSHGFHYSPTRFEDRKQPWVHSFLWEKWMQSQMMTSSFTPLSPRHISSEHSDTKMAFFRHTNQEKINFVWDLSLSQQHILARSGNRCFLSCFPTDINGHLNGLKGETMN